MTRTDWTKIARSEAITDPTTPEWVKRAALEYVAADAEWRDYTEGSGVGWYLAGAGFFGGIAGLAFRSFEQPLALIFLGAGAAIGVWMLSRWAQARRSGLRAFRLQQMLLQAGWLVSCFDGRLSLRRTARPEV